MDKKNIYNNIQKQKRTEKHRNIMPSGNTRAFPYLPYKRYIFFLYNIEERDIQFIIGIEYNKTFYTMCTPQPFFFVYTKQDIILLRK